MIQPSIRLLFVLLTCLAWAGVAAADCGDPFDPSSCQTQELEADDPPGGDECGGPISVAGTSTASTSMIVSLANSSGTLAEGFIVVTVLIDGQPYDYVFPVSVAGEGEMSVLVLFPKSSTPVGVIVCTSQPGGINEGPDVVGIREEEQAP
ncbi:MAG: hypothetical protein GTN89_04575 [Acidobacteria bacterium]|nr:hypothetical protein [Acidobacteriota bacterium]NIM60420.1 hypothetical protein [Acidobacteriota bacterium]NIO58595.1 hypothetical protein [Acidobacteriota bacterium]NIQ29647.1 hypothetical protein [Acidobacteriota bacterium]NIQ84364.1 hypothetical protein [Acidobacteriota bacterium]